MSFVKRKYISFDIIVYNNKLKEMLYEKIL